MVKSSGSCSFTRADPATATVLSVGHDIVDAVGTFEEGRHGTLLRLAVSRSVSRWE